MIKRKPWFAFLVLGMLTAMLWGCQKAELNQKIPAFQFVRGYGVVKSTDRVYVLNAEAAVEQTKGDVTITLVDAVQQGQKLIVNLMVSDYSEREKPDEKRYGEAIWITGEGIKVTGPGILEENSRPIESQYIPWSEFYEEYGYMRYFMAASFELFPDSNVEEYPAAYSCSILAVGEAVKEGILVEWYSYSESGRTASISFTPPGQIPDRPILSLQEREYPAERKLLYTKKLELYQPEGRCPGRISL